MSYKILTNAKVLMSMDGSKSLAIDTGGEVIPVCTLSDATNVIDLSKYKVNCIEADGTIVSNTLDYIVFTLIRSGGGRVEIDTDHRKDLFEDLDSDKPVVIRFPFDGMPVSVFGATVIRWDDNVPSILCFSAVAPVSAMPLKIDVIIGMTYVQVFVQPVIGG